MTVFEYLVNLSYQLIDFINKLDISKLFTFSVPWITDIWFIDYLPVVSFGSVPLITVLFSGGFTVLLVLYVYKFIINLIPGS